MVVIGNAQHRWFRNADAGDHVAALAFPRRPDVQVRNWYRRHGTPTEAHLKAWIGEGASPPVLSGSANLTSAGLFNNREVMAEIHGPDRIVRRDTAGCSNNLRPPLRGRGPGLQGRFEKR